MLPGLGFSEIVVLGIIALLVVGPKDLPLMMRKLGRFMARMRGMAAEFRSGFDELARQAELDELRREVNALRNTARDGVSGFTRELTKPMDDARDAVMAPLAATETAPAPVEAPQAAAAIDPPGPISDPEPPALVPEPAKAASAGGGR